MAEQTFGSDTPAAPQDPPKVDAVVTDEGVKVRLAEEGTPPQGEGLIGGKFKSQDDLLSAYQALEKKLGAGEKPADDPAPKAEEKPLEQEELRIEAKKAEEAGIDLDALQKEWAENDGLSDKTYQTLEGRGIPRQMVDRYIEGQQAVAAKVTGELSEMAGGSDALRGALEWAAANLPESEIAAYNGALESGNMGFVRMSLRGILSSYQTAEGKAPNLVGGGRAPTNSGPAPFRSQAEMLEAMGDPRYSTDPAFRDDVVKRLAVTEM